jgi:hypothetical protein
MRHAPFRPGLEAIAHTLAYDAAIIGDRSLPAGLLAAVTIPALVITGEQSPRSCATPRRRPQRRCQTGGGLLSLARAMTSIPTPPRR